MDILGDRKFVEVPGTATHELPPLLVHMSPDVKRLDRVMGMASDLIDHEDLRFDMGGDSMLAFSELARSPVEEASIRDLIQVR